MGTPDPQTIRGYLKEQLRVEELPRPEQQLNAALAAEVPHRIRRHAREVALDYHDRPYDGKGEQDRELWVRGKAKDGTTHFYRVATAYVVLDSLRVTVALHFVLPGVETVGVLNSLLQRIYAQGIALSCLLRDKGFAGTAVMEYLTQQGYPALMVCTVRGRQGRTRALCQGRKNYSTAHTFKGPHGTEFTALVSVCRVFTTVRRTGRGCPGVRSGCSSSKFTLRSPRVTLASSIGGGLAWRPAIAVVAKCAAGRRPRTRPIGSS